MITEGLGAIHHLPSRNLFALDIFPWIWAASWIPFAYRGLLGASHAASRELERI